MVLTEDSVVIGLATNATRFRTRRGISLRSADWEIDRKYGRPHDTEYDYRSRGYRYIYSCKRDTTLAIVFDFTGREFKLSRIIAGRVGYHALKWIAVRYPPPAPPGSPLEEPETSGRSQ
jgi:hypothetical protein